MGVATLFGSGSTDYRKALVPATSATFLGSLTAIYKGNPIGGIFLAWVTTLPMAAILSGLAVLLTAS